VYFTVISYGTKEGQRIKKDLDPKEYGLGYGAGVTSNVNCNCTIILCTWDL
jgi:hypothetical protein